MAMLEAFIDEVEALPDVCFERLDRYVATWTSLPDGSAH
jgi:hypothetical protein